MKRWSRSSMAGGVAARTASCRRGLQHPGRLAAVQRLSTYLNVARYNLVETLAFARGGQAELERVWFERCHNPIISERRFGWLRSGVIIFGSQTVQTKRGPPAYQHHGRGDLDTRRASCLFLCIPADRTVAGKRGQHDVAEQPADTWANSFRSTKPDSSATVTNLLKC